jgi:hypothetical protein
MVVSLTLVSTFISIRSFVRRPAAEVDGELDPRIPRKSPTPTKAKTTTIVTRIQGNLDRFGAGGIGTGGSGGGWTGGITGGCGGATGGCGGYQRPSAASHQPGPCDVSLTSQSLPADSALS